MMLDSSDGPGHDFPSGEEDAFDLNKRRIFLNAVQITADRWNCRSITFGNVYSIEAYCWYVPYGIRLGEKFIGR
jgi:hypothetical protein